MKNLFQALVKAQSAARPVEKDSRNTFHKYAYASAEALIIDAKRLLSDVGLGIIPNGSMVGGTPADTLSSTWLLVHSDSGESLQLCTSWVIVPEKGRPLDKALAAARTASLAYLLRDLLQFPRVEKGTGLDDDSRDHHQAKVYHVSKTGNVSRSPIASPERKMLEKSGEINVLQLAARAELDRLGVAAGVEDDEKARAVRMKALKHAGGGAMPKTVEDWEGAVAYLRELDEYEASTP